MSKKLSAVTCFCLIATLIVSCHSAKFSTHQKKTLNRYVWKTKQHLSRTAQLKSLVDRRIKMNPHSVAKDFYPVLDNVSKKLSKIHKKLRTQIASNEAMPRYEIRKIKRALHSTRLLLTQTNQHILKGAEQVLESDVLFEVGSSQLKAAGVVSLNQFARYFKNRILPIYKDQMRIKINITGYADEQGFVKGESNKQRQQKNRLLSLNRATSVKRYLSIILEQSFEQSSKVIWFDIQVEGKGEQLPPKLLNPHRNDRRRRICTVSSYAIIQSGEKVPVIKQPRILTTPSPVKE